MALIYFHTVSPCRQRAAAWGTCAYAAVEVCGQLLFCLQVAVSSRLEKLFHSSFLQTAVPTVEDDVVTLKSLLGPEEDRPQSGVEEEDRPRCNRRVFPDDVISGCSCVLFTVCILTSKSSISNWFKLVCSLTTSPTVRSRERVTVANQNVNKMSESFFERGTNPPPYIPVLESDAVL